MAKNQTATEPEAPPAAPEPNGNTATTAKRIRKAPLAPKDETKEQRFRRLAPRRVARAMKTIKAVQNLSSKATYAYSEAQSEWVQAQVIQAVNAMVEAFSRKTATAEALVMPE